MTITAGSLGTDVLEIVTTGSAGIAIATASTTTTPGSISITAGTSVGSSTGSGGNLLLSAGGGDSTASPTTTGGSVSIIAGSGTGFANGGNVYVTAGASAAETAGNVVISAGASTGVIKLTATDGATAVVTVEQVSSISGLYAARSANTFFKVGTAQSTLGLITGILQYTFSASTGWSGGGDSLSSANPAAYRDFSLTGYTPTSTDVVIVSLSGGQQYVTSGRPNVGGSTLEVTVMVSAAAGTQTVHSSGGTFNIVIFQFH